MISIYIEILIKLYESNDSKQNIFYQKLLTYESNIEGCLEDIVNVLKSKYDEFSDFSESDDD